MGETSYFENQKRMSEGGSQSVTRYPTGGYGITGSWGEPTRSAIPMYSPGEVKSFSPIQKIDPGPQQPNPTVRAGVGGDPYGLSILEQMNAQRQSELDAAKAKGPTITIGAPPVDPGANDSWRNRVYADRAANNSRPASGYQSGQATVSPQQQAIPYPTAPEFKPPEYSPPEEDKNAYSQARREAIAPGLRELREGTREAVASAQSLDNPNARARFIQESLKGYGKGLEGVAAGAMKEARGVAAQKRSDQLQIYKSQFDVKSNAYLQNYNQQINKIATDFLTQQTTGINPATNAQPSSSAAYQRLIEARQARM